MDLEVVQRHRINRVVNFVRNQSETPLSLNDLADVACLSRYHFSRVFSKHCQETPIQFVSRLRLEQSVSKLIFRPEKSITSVAFDAGFSSSQAYSNAFLRRYGISPRDFRRNNLWYAWDFPQNQFALSPELMAFERVRPKPPENSKVTLQKMPKMRLAYLRHRGAYYNTSRSHSLEFLRLVAWAKARGLWDEDTLIYGVCPDNPAVTPPQFCQYDMGLSVEHGVREDETVSIREIPEATLATLRVPAASANGREAWGWLLSVWLPQSGLTKAGDDFFEIAEFSGDPLRCSEPDITICVPVKHTANPPKSAIGTMCR